MSRVFRHFYRFGQFRLDMTEHSLYRHNGEVVPLKPKVVETLELLVQERGRLISKDELMERLWPNTTVEESNLTQYIYLLRKVMGADPGGRNYIETVPKRGYRFTAEVEVFEPDDKLAVTKIEKAGRGRLSSSRDERYETAKSTLIDNQTTQLPVVAAKSEPATWRRFFLPLFILLLLGG